MSPVHTDSELSASWDFIVTLCTLSARICMGREHLCAVQRSKANRQRSCAFCERSAAYYPSTPLSPRCSCLAMKSPPQADTRRRQGGPEPQCWLLAPCLEVLDLRVLPRLLHCPPLPALAAGLVVSGVIVAAALTAAVLAQGWRLLLQPCSLEPAAAPARASTGGPIAVACLWKRATA